MTLDCLWLARAIPYPFTAGDRPYTAHLAEALAEQEANITFLGLPDAPDWRPPARSAIHWQPVPDRPNHRLRALFSTLPLAGGACATAAFRRAVREQLASRPWDVVVIDQYGMGWVLDELPRRSDRSRPLVVHIAHDHEESVTRSLWRNHQGSLWSRAFLYQNYLKTRRIEHRLVEASDLITTITAEDAALFERQHPETPRIVLTPGYAGCRLAERRITAEVPRRIVMFGSYHWLAKQINLRRFLETADPVCAQHGIEISIVGSGPEEFRRALAPMLRATRFAGFVDDPAPYFASSRIAILAEPIGGGFKMKLLEYIFHRMPIMALDNGIAGLPPELIARIAAHSTLSSMVDDIVRSIDDLDRLNRMQDESFAAASDMFDWSTRGRALMDALTALLAHRRASQGNSAALDRMVHS